jgi:hypothetical protein
LPARNEPATAKGRKDGGQLKALLPIPDPICLHEVCFAHWTTQAAGVNGVFQLFGILPCCCLGVGAIERFRQVDPLILVKVNCKHNLNVQTNVPRYKSETIVIVFAPSELSFCLTTEFIGQNKHQRATIGNRFLSDALLWFKIHK